jgi:type IV secretion system protein VirB9
VKYIVALFVCVFSFSASAEITPTKGATDSRVRVVEYNRDEVVKLATYYGVSTHIEFAPNERILDKGLGDEKAWTAKDRENHLYLQPKAENADTNITVVTNQRTYNFALVVEPVKNKDPNAWKNPNLVFDLRFRYPEQEALALIEQGKAVAAKAEQKRIKAKLSAVLTEVDQANDNFDYWVAGTDAISPTSARDNGQFIYLTFSNNRDIPAVYVVDDEGHEALVNTTVVHGNSVVIQRMARQLMLRKENMVVSVLNKSFDPDAGYDNETGTVAADVVRVTKDAQ